MKRLTFIATLLFFVFSSSSFAQTEYPHKVTKVIDSDTIELENGERVRYIGIDTPETVHPTQSSWIRL